MIIDIKVLLFAAFIISILFLTYKMDSDCNEKGGILVQGAVRLECVKSLEKVE